MSRIKVLIVSLLAVFAVSSVASATASAELQGPWWKQEEGGKQIKLPLKEERQIKSRNEGAFQLKGTLGGMPATIKCEEVTNKGNIWNGLHQGQDNAEVIFETCSLVEPAGCKKGIEKVEVEPTKVYTELMWKYRGESGELTSVGQQKIYDVFAPEATPVNGKALFTNIKIKEANPLCSGTLAVKAVGTQTTFEDQNGVLHEVVWGTAALVEPQNQDKQFGFLRWQDPNQTKLHHQGKGVAAKLEFAEHPAELQGKIKVEENSGVAFGAWNE